MPIDVATRRSPGWWMKRLFQQLHDRKRRTRLQLLHDYRRGEARLPQGAENMREAFRIFQSKARANFAELIVSAVSERMTPVGFRTAIDRDETGDADVGKLWARAGLDVTAADIHDLMLTLGEAYVIVGGLDDETGAPLITAEDPRYMVGEPDPANPRKLLAALKWMHDDAESEDRAYLFLPGSATESGNAQVWVARKVNAAVLVTDTERLVTPRTPMPAFHPQGWEWDEERSGELPHGRMPVVRFANKDCLGEFEAHLDVLDRINHQILQRMVISTMQAFRQRAAKNLPLTDEDTGEEIDYSEVFVADPGALWQLPEGTELWESGQVDLSPILSAVKDDVQHLAAQTRTPLHLLSPAGVNQSAEGASLSREGLIFKTDDRITRTSAPWAQVMSLALLAADMSDRADLAELETIWAPSARLSLAEKADAASKLKDLLPRRTLLIKVLGFSPAEADRVMTEIADDQLLAAQMVQLAAGQQQPGADGAPVPGQRGAQRQEPDDDQAAVAAEGSRS